MLIRPRVRVWLTLLVIITLLTSSGCWSRREMESLAYVLLLGVDKTDNGIKLIAQVGLPNQEPGGGGDDPVVNLLVAEGRDMSEAMNNMFLQSTKRPNLNHLRLVLITENMAREGVWEVLDFLRRDIRVRLNTKVAVTPDDIEELLEIEDALSSQPALAIIDQFNINSERSRVLRAELMDLVSQLLERDREAAIPVIRAGDDRFDLGETAVFKQYRMVATADKHQTFGLLLWRNRVRSGIITMPQVGASQVVSFRINTSRTEVRVRWLDGKLHVQANVNMELDINEMHGQIEDLESRANHYIINRMMDTLELAQKEGTDFLDLSARLRRQDLGAWQEQQENWEDVLRNAQFDLRSSVIILGQGQIR